MKTFVIATVAAVAAADVQRVDVNHADAVELDTLYQVGAATAQNIIDYRTLNGDFATLEDLIQVSGITQNRIDGMLARDVRPIVCPTVSCANPAPCFYVANSELNDDFCPKYPCGVRKCNSQKCCDPSNSAHVSHTTTCEVKKETCEDWITALEASKLHYVKDAAAKSKMAADIATRACAGPNAEKNHFWIKVNHKNEVAANEFKCARTGSKETPDETGCACCECVDGAPVTNDVITQAVGEDNTVVVDPQE
jgi:competence ComEA-like helix-hairpin-helix protein